MLFLLPRYLLNLLLLLRLHLVLLLKIHLDHLGRTIAITTRSMVMLSLSVADYSLSNLLARTLHSSLFVLLLLLILKRLLKASLPNFPFKIFKLCYNNFSHNFSLTLVNLPYKSCLSPQVPLSHGILTLPIATI